MVTYGSESWTLTKNDQVILRRFERKIVRGIYAHEWETKTDWEYIGTYSLIIIIEEMNDDLNNNGQFFWRFSFIMCLIICVELNCL